MYMTLNNLDTVQVYSSITEPILSVSDSELSIVSGKFFASLRYVLQSFTPYDVVPAFLALLKYHMIEVIWAQTPTTRAPARHVQYHELTSDSEYLIHTKYFLDDT